MRQRSRTPRLARAFSLIEVVVVLVVLAVAVPASMVVIRDASVQRSGAVLAARARCLAVEMIEDIIADRHSSARGWSYVVGSNYPAEPAIKDFPGFTRSVSITETGASLSGSGTGYKTVTVTVAWTDPLRGAVSTNLVTVVTDY